MRYFEIVQAPAAVLSTKARPVTMADPALLAFIENMKATLLAQDSPSGLGLAANQVGSNLAVFVARLDKKGQATTTGTVREFINPKILGRSREKIPAMTLVQNGGLEKQGKEEGTDGKTSESPEFPLEGCLSIQNLWAVVRRYRWVKIKYQRLRKKNSTDELEIHEEKFEGLAAVIVQHEMDHLEGILFTQRLLKQKGKLYRIVGKDGKGKEIFEEIKLD